MRARQGFTLIEVLVATSLLTLGLGTAAMLMAGAFGTYRSQNHTLEINHLVHDQMEKLSSTTYESLAADMKKARRPGDPVREDLPPERDFQTEGRAGAVSAAYDMVPPPDGQDAYSIRRRGAAKGPTFELGKKKDRDVKVELRLEYWDPVFDKPVDTDRGLIRADYRIDWEGVKDSGVKYLAR